ncbi:MAG: hypothetical protein OEX00_09045 [Gammaproteobacteria bacterium]|nr:hypothetical protein [Gammaproteobacteria bacterium]MDH5692548.1 hypothetical protein [Gammaproteobacteria bacterium]
MPFGRNAKLRPLVVPRPPDSDLGSGAEQDESATIPRQHESWAGLLKRVFNIDFQTCPHCQGNLKILASIEDPPTNVKILSIWDCQLKHRLGHPPDSLTDTISYNPFYRVFVCCVDEASASCSRPSPTSL